METFAQFYKHIFVCIVGFNVGLVGGMVCLVIVVIVIAVIGVIFYYRSVTITMCYYDIFKLRHVIYLTCSGAICSHGMNCECCSGTLNFRRRHNKDTGQHSGLHSPGPDIKTGHDNAGYEMACESMHRTHPVTAAPAKTG